MLWYKASVVIATICSSVQGLPTIEQPVDAAALEERARVHVFGNAVSVVGGIIANNALGDAFHQSGQAIAEGWVAAIADQIHPHNLLSSRGLWVPQVGQSGLSCWTVSAIYVFGGPSSVADAAAESFAASVRGLLGRRSLNGIALADVYRSDVDLPADHSVFGNFLADGSGVKSRDIGHCHNPSFDFTHDQSNSALCLPQGSDIRFPTSNSVYC